MNQLHEAAAKVSAPDRPGVGAVFRRSKEVKSPDGFDVLDGKEWVERRAKLFEAGTYPDKGVTVSAEHLESLAAGFATPVPDLIEHSNSALHMGFLTRVEALGNELFGTIALTKEANDLLESSGARGLSLGLTSDLSEIREVSIVRSPRVADAELYSGFCFCGELCDLVGEFVVWNPDFARKREAEHKDTKGSSEDFGAGGLVASEQPGTSMLRPSLKAPDLRHPPFPTSSKQGELESSPCIAEALSNTSCQPHTDSSPDSRFEDLRREVRLGDAHRTVEGFVREGKICPAQAPFAEAMLQAEDVIEFDGESRPIRQLLIAMIERQPPMALFSAAVPENVSVDSESGTRLLPEEAEFYRRHFPDVSLEEIAARRGR